MNISKTTIRIALAGLVLATSATVAAGTTQSFVLDSADAFFEGELEGAELLIGIEGFGGHLVVPVDGLEATFADDPEGETGGSYKTYGVPLSLFQTSPAREWIVNMAVRDQYGYVPGISSVIVLSEASLLTSRSMRSACFASTLAVGSSNRRISGRTARALARATR